MERSLLFMGDTHSITITGDVLYNKDIEDSNVVHVGDFGIGFGDDTQEMSMLDELLKKRNIQLYVQRGNHDDPKYFRQDDHTFDEFTNINLVPDYSILNLSNKNILCVGGAHSIDRVDKRKRNQWLSDEVFKLDEDRLKKIVENGPIIDIVVTHTAPHYCEPRILGSLVYHYAMQDPSLIADLDAERFDVTKLAMIIKPKLAKNAKWYMGHFHHSHVEKIDGVEYIMLNINELKEIR